MNFKGVIQDFKEHELINKLYQENQRQADRIAELEKIIQYGIQSFGVLQKQMSQFAQGELVLWGKFDEDNQMVEYFSEDARKSNYLFAEDAKSDVWIPLYAYTTPQTKPLSDEEIKEILYEWDRKYASIKDSSMVIFARAIEERIKNG